MSNLTSCFFHLLLISCVFYKVCSFQVGCNARNGHFYRHGETTVTRESNNRLYKCTCTNGQRQCSVTKEDAYVLIADVNQINKITLAAGRGFENKYIQNLPGTAVAVAVDIESDFIFWTDVSYQGRGIYRARYSDGSRITRIISYEIFEPNGIAVDWLSKNIYWTDAQLGAIFVAKNDGKMRTRLISGLPEPRSIILLPRDGLMFWSDQTAGAIERARMDGSDRRIIITGLIWPNEIAADRLTRRIYWIDAYRKRIESCNFNGGEYSRIFDYSYTGYNLPGFGLALFENHLYFGVWNTTGTHSSIFSITNIGQHFKPILRSLGSKPMGMTIINRDLQTHRRNTNPCWSPGSGLCSHLCLPTSHNSYRCACPSFTGLVLSNNGRSCIVPDTFLLYTSLVEGTVMMVSTEKGADKASTLFAQTSQPSAVAFDPVDRIVYWSDVALNAIFRKRLGDINATKFIQDGIGTVDGLCVDYVNRHLYFTNMGWYSENSPFHQVEMVDLRDAGKRKILTSSLLEKPRDILIDQDFGKFLYVSDWGSEPKVVRMDLDGQSPFILPITVQNPNGLALNGYNLYVVDSHLKSALIGGNDTVIYGRPPTLITYDTRFTNSSNVDMINIEIPFGLTNSKNKLYMTDWGLQGIYEVDVSQSSVREFVVGIEKPTGIVAASIRYKHYATGCSPNTRQCSDMCVSIATVEYQCMCPDRSGTALSNFNCVLPDTFLLVADESQIVMMSFDPVDDQRYAVVRTFDLLSNIVALTYDPEADFIYWADNGRQRVLRKNFRDKYAEHEIIYTDIGQIEGMALDPVHRLLYWTDAEKGTIELLALSRRIHATVRTQLSSPRAIALNPDSGMMYWTEEGTHPMVLSATMTGQDIRPLISQNLKWPNALYFDHESDLLWVADGGTLEIMSITAEGDATILDQRNVNRTADHIYGLWRDPTSNSVSMIFSDWEKRSVIRGSEIIMKDLIRPSQLYLQKPYRGPIIYDHCEAACSHICIPTQDSYVCMCPDELTLSSDLQTCLTADQLFQLTSTTEIITTTTRATTTTPTTVPWAEIIVEVETTTDYKKLASNVTSATNLMTIAEEINITTIQPTTRVLMTTTPATTTTTLPETTTIPGDPYFKNCDETNSFEIGLPDYSPYANVTSTLLGLQAFDGNNQTLPVLVLDEVTEELVHFLQLPAANLTVSFLASDIYGRQISCDVKLVITDQTPPEVHFCPSDMQVETYSERGEAFVDWKSPKFVDNSDSSLQITQTHDPGLFRIGLHDVIYEATDNSGNKNFCSFQLVVLRKDSDCHKPSAPRNSQLMCKEVNKIQECRISCDEFYEMSLADPNIKCEKNVEAEKSAWVPFLSSGICAKPLVSNVEQEVVLQYLCPCQQDFRYYDNTRNYLFKSLRDYPGCKSYQNRLGFCNTRNKGKLLVECIKDTTLNVTVYVDLDNLRGMRSTREVKDLVGRGVNDIIERALDGKIVAPGYSNRKSYTVDTAALRVSKARVKCENGHKSTKEGCVQCPKGTSLERNECKFCSKNSYQDEAGREHCIKCPEGKGTTIYGATDKRYCVETAVAELTFTTLIITTAIGVVLFVAAAVFLIVCVKRRKRNNKIKKELERKRREQQERRRRRKPRAKKNKTTDKEGKISTISNGVAATLNEKNTKPTEISNTKTTENSIHKNSAEDKNQEKSTSSQNSNPKDTLTTEQEIKKDNSEDVNSETNDGESSTIFEAQSDTTSVVSSDPPLKSVLKKPKIAVAPPPESYLEDDTSTVISASTITSAQLRRANIKPRASSLDQDTQPPGFERGRTTGRSINGKRQAASVSKVRNEGATSNSAQNPNLRRSISFERRDGPPPRRTLSQYTIPTRPGLHPQMRPNISQQGPQMGAPVPQGPQFMIGPPQVNRPPIYGSFSQQRMQARPVAGMYQPAGGPRHPLNGLGGSLPRLHSAPHPSGFWNDGFDPSQSWNQMAIRSRPDIPPSHPMMTFPRGSRPPPYRIPGGIPNMRPYPRMQNPPVYYP